MDNKQIFQATNTIIAVMTYNYAHISLYSSSHATMETKLRLKPANRKPKGHSKVVSTGIPLLKISSSSFIIIHYNNFTGVVLATTSITVQV